MPVSMHQSCHWLASAISPCFMASKCAMSWHSTRVNTTGSGNESRPHHGARSPTEQPPVPGACCIELLTLSPIAHDQTVTSSRRDLHQDAADLPSGDVHIVGPLQADWQARLELLQRMSDRQSGGQRDP